MLRDVVEEIEGQAVDMSHANTPSDYKATDDLRGRKESSRPGEGGVGGYRRFDIYEIRTFDLLTRCVIRHEEATCAVEDRSVFSNPDAVRLAKLPTR